MGGAGVWEVLLPAPPTLDPDYLQRVRAFQERLRGITIRNLRGQGVPGLTKVLSLVDAIDATEVHPVLRRIPAELRVRGMSAAMPRFLAARTTVTQTRTGGATCASCCAPANSRTRRGKCELIHEVMRIATEHFPATAGQPGAAGHRFLRVVDPLDHQFLRDQWICFAVATSASP